MRGPPVTLRLKQVPEYLQRVHGIKISYLTITRWIKTGYGNETLETRQVKDKPPFKRFVFVTTEQWVDEFVNRTGMGVKRC